MDFILSLGRQAQHNICYGETQSLSFIRSIDIAPPWDPVSGIEIHEQMSEMSLDFSSSDRILQEMLDTITLLEQRVVNAVCNVLNMIEGSATIVRMTSLFISDDGKARSMRPTSHVAESCQPVNRTLKI